MTYGIVIAFIIMCLTFRKDNKAVFIFGLITLWILFGWSSGNADRRIYLERFYAYNGSFNSSISEPLFTNLMKIFNIINFDYQTFLIIISLIIMGIYGMFINKTTKNITFVFLLYLIFPFAMEVVQLRYTIASAIMVIGFYYLVKKDKKERNY